METVAYCLIGVESVCLPSSDWAAWVQALGSLLGLLIAIAIPTALEMRRRNESKLDAKNQARAVAAFIANGVEGVATRYGNMPLPEPSVDPGDIATLTFASSFEGTQSPVLPKRYLDCVEKFPAFGTDAACLFDLISKRDAMEWAITIFVTTAHHDLGNGEYEEHARKAAAVRDTHIEFRAAARTAADMLNRRHAGK